MRASSSCSGELALANAFEAAVASAPASWTNASKFGLSGSITDVVIK
jgi:hypothetical protein